MTDRCSSCGQEHDRKGQRHCLPCKAAYMRDWRKVNPMNDGQRKRDSARSIASMAVKRGQIKQEPCRVCGSAKSEMHHPDHELPKLVVWLCRGCHLAWHAHWREVAAQTWESWLQALRRKDAA
jgi:hypothetical protein